MKADIHSLRAIRAGRLLRSLLWLTALLWSSLSTAGSDCSDAPIRATFIQPSHADLQRDRWEWRRLLLANRELGIRSLYLQWSAWGDYDFSRARLVDGAPFIATLLSQAEELGMRVHLGLAAEPTFGSYLSLPTEQLAARLRELRRRSLALARELAPLASKSPAFAGWYLAEEIDDLHWRDAARTELLKQHLREEQRGLAPLLAGAPVSISAFLSGQPPAAEFISLWDEIWRDSQLRLLLQDGAGVHQLPSDTWLARAKPLGELARSRGREWGIVVELFQQRSGTPIDDGEFSADAAPPERLKAQLALAQSLPKVEIGSFATVNYLLNDGSDGAQRLYDGYRATYCRD